MWKAEVPSLLIPSIRFTKLIIHYLKTKHNIHPRTDSPLYYSYEDHVLGTLRSVGKDGREIFDEERGKAAKQTKPSAPKETKVTKLTSDEAPKHTSSQPPKSTPAPTESSKKDQGKKCKLVKEISDAPSVAKQSKVGKVTKKRMPKSPLRLVDEFVDEGVPEKEPAYGDEEANLQRALKLSVKDQEERTQLSARLVVFREPDSRRFQPLSKVQGKGKEKVIEEQAAHDLLTLQTPKRKSPTYQFIFQRHTPIPTVPSGNAESPSLDAELAPTYNETESNKEVPHVNPEKVMQAQMIRFRPKTSRFEAWNEEIAVNQQIQLVIPFNTLHQKDASYRELNEINNGDQDEGQAGPNPSKQDEGHAGSNPGDAAKSQPQSSHVVHAEPNLEHMDLEVTDALTQQNPNQINEDFTITAYPNVPENLKLPTEDQVILEKPTSSTGTLSSLHNLDKELSFTNQFLIEKPQEEEPEKTNTESEVQSMVTVPIHQDPL
ncbi:retrovirus-related pol polyprotein from transposon TNT 1-94 [Tanacetum coccineum]|uniref:Retrovirus-related pol polyprotein from transposon TNT 1-94 n=1 Tax=Tanacetum coccineum TaxID=301880 RepID=A0ABQ4ZMA5_9ASTR